MPEESEYKKALLERSSAIKDRFNDAGTGKEQGRAQERGAEGTGAKQVQSQASEMHLRPKGPIRDAVDSQVHQEAMSKDDQAAKEYNDKLIERMQKIKDGQSTENNVNSKDENSKD